MPYSFDSKASCFLGFPIKLSKQAVKQLKECSVQRQQYQETDFEPCMVPKSMLDLRFRVMEHPCDFFEKHSALKSLRNGELAQ